MDPRWNRRHSVKRLVSIPLPSIAAVLLGVVLQCPPKASSAPLVEFHVPAGDATLTLNEFSRQAHLQLLWDFNIVKGRVTQAVDGLYEPRDALRHMLGNTGLVFAVVNERTLAVTPMRSASRAGGSAAPPATHSHPAQQPNNQTLAQQTGSAETEPATPADIETVRVTGTLLSGEAPVGASVLEFDREALDESGLSSVADFMGTLPQVFGGGPTQDTHLGSEAATNSGYGTGVNLRGLGARATLVLINGRRIAPGGTDAEFVDIENIPFSALERIEILPDSASALYGADAVGGVVNYIMRDNFVGAETTLSAGTGTQNTLKNYVVSQTVGQKWDDVSGMISVEFYRRDALPASDRSYAVSNLTPFGGSDFDTYLTNPGNLVVNGVTYAIPKGQDGTHLSASSLVPGTLNLADRYLDTDILPEQQRWSLYSAGHANPTDRLSLFADVLVSTREATERTPGEMASLTVPSSNPFYVNPMGGIAPVIVEYNFADDLGVDINDVRVNATSATVGLDFDAGASWKISAYGSYARETENQSQTGLANLSAVEAALADPDPATAFNPFGDGSHTSPQTLSTLTAPAWYRGDSQLEMADITADGPLWQLPGGPVKLAIGSDRRNESFDSDTSASGIFQASGVRLSRQITAAFAELVLPLFGKDNDLPGLRRLELSSAARYDDYSNFGHDTTPKFGLVWSPATDLSFRGTWSRSVRPPSLNDLDESRNIVQAYPLADPRSPSGQTVALIWSGNNAQLREERAKTWTTGLDFSPERIPGLTAGLTWFNIDFDDRIEDTLFSPDMLSNPQYSGLVTFNPSPTLVDYVCSHALPVGLTQSECMAAGAAGALIDLRVHNLETLRTQGFDFNTQYEVQGRYGRLKFELNGTYLTKFSLAEGNGSPTTDVLNLQNNPINLRFKGSVGWSGTRLGGSMSVNYSNSYRDTLSVPNRPVAAWTTIDAQIRYKLGAFGGGPFDNTQIQLNAFNLFNRDPPFLNNAAAGIGYDQENADPYGRMLSLLIRKSW